MVTNAPACDAIFDWAGPRGLPEFGRIDDRDFEPAFRVAIENHAAEIDAIAALPDPPDFVNVIDALELAGKKLSRVSALFYNRAAAHTNDEIRTLERKMAPILSRHFTKIGQNRRLFQRVEGVWRSRDRMGLNGECVKVLEKHRRGLVRSGAALKPEGQQRLAAVNERLSVLGAQFAQNVQTDEAEWVMHLTGPADLAGLPCFLTEAMAQVARERGLETGHAVILSRSIIEPFLAFSQQRALRERAFLAWISRGDGNWPLIGEILDLRREKARLLGYRNYAAYKLEDTMAATPAAVKRLLGPVWARAVEKAGAEARDLAALIAEEGRNHQLEPWDWRYYAEKERNRQFDFSETEIKPYFQLEAMIEAAFEVAGRLFGLKFVARSDIAAWHEDVRVFEVFGADDRLVGIFFGDYLARASKRSGAWMSALQSAHKLDGGELPLICNIMNFARGNPTLLSLDDARTLFHEFGHALHGLLSDVTYPSISGTSVARDFVELPSQLFEHWLTVPNIMKKYARHHETGEPIPDALIEKIAAAETFDSGFRTVEFTASALVDMAYHTTDIATDPAAFEESTLEDLGMPREIVMRHRSPHFLHVFAGDGYSAGYYAYLWSEVLDADAFNAFREAGDPFDAAWAAKLREHIYASGGSRDPGEAYEAYRGRLPTPDAMMAGRGLV